MPPGPRLARISAQSFPFAVVTQAGRTLGDFAVAMLLWGGKSIGDQMMRRLLEEQIATADVPVLNVVEEEA